MSGPLKALAGLAILGGVGAGAFVAIRRLRQADGNALPNGAPDLPRVPLPPQDIHDLLPILACPICKSSLRISDDEQQLICDSCRVAYAIEDGIPVLLPDSGKPLA